MIVYHCNTNLILMVPFKTRKDTNSLKEYDKIMQRLSDHKLTVDLQIIDNEASVEYKRVIKKKWKINYQLVPPNTYLSNAVEQAICTIKAHFISILAGVAPDLPRNLWDLLIPQTEVTLNLFRQTSLETLIDHPRRTFTAH